MRRAPIEMASEQLQKFLKRSWAIKLYASERWGTQIPCPIRLVVNPYHSCSYKCPHCYVWSDKGEASVKKGFRKALLDDIKRAKDQDLRAFVVEMSPSTDPFQPIELEKGESLYAIEELLRNGFKVVLVTRNPAVLLQEAYRHLLDDKNVSIDVTISSLKEDSAIVRNRGPSAEQKIEAVKRIIALGKGVRVRIDPVIPSVNRFSGQTAEELKELVARLSEIGVKLIITKTMRLSKGMPQPVIDDYYEYYKKNGKLEGTIYVLSAEIRRKMLMPIYEACKRRGVDFCPCCDVDAFAKERTSTCRVEGETRLFARDIQIQTRTGD